MKVKDILPKKHRMEQCVKNLHQLEKFFRDNGELAEEIADKADCNMSLQHLFCEVAIHYEMDVKEIEEKINNAEIQ